MPATDKEYEPLADLLTGPQAHVVMAGQGLRGRRYRARLAATGRRC